mgnify:CR=1 FL=1
MASGFFAPKQKSWEEISESFLSKTELIELPAPSESFEMIDTTRSREFVKGNNAESWNEVRKKAHQDSKDKRRRARK